MTLRIAFVQPYDDAAWIGGRNYLASLITAAHAVAPSGLKMVLVTGRKVKCALQDELPFLEVVRTPLLDRGDPRWLGRQLLRVSHRRRQDPVFERLLRHLRIDVLSHAEPWVTRHSPIKTLGWLPDFQFLHLPEYWTEPQRARIAADYRLIAENCDGVILSSHAALRDLERFAPSANTTRHVLHFVPRAFQVKAFRTFADLRRLYELPERYLHLPNQFWAHKNHGLVLQALALLRSAGETPTVVCTGGTVDTRRPDFFELLMRQCRALGLEPNFRVLGVVPYADMQSLMWHARAVINPSRFEGWSTTVEEAKWMGKKVLLSDLPVHREQAPERGSFFDVDDASALAEAMEAAAEAEANPQDAASLEKRYAAATHEFGRRYLDVVESILSTRSSF